MKKHIEKTIGSVAVMLFVLVAGTALQGCGDQEEGYLLGPQTDAIESYASDGAANGTLNVPTRDCETEHTARAAFYNPSKTTDFRLTVYGEFRGIVKAQSSLTLTVKEGVVEWFAVPLIPMTAPVISGTFEAKRCGKYEVQIALPAVPRPHAENLD